MSKNVVCCNPETALADVARLMAEHDCGEIPRRTRNQPQTAWRHYRSRHHLSHRGSWEEPSRADRKRLYVITGHYGGKGLCIGRLLSDDGSEPNTTGASHRPERRLLRYRGPGRCRPRWIEENSRRGTERSLASDVRAFAGRGRVTVQAARRRLCRVRAAPRAAAFRSCSGFLQTGASRANVARS